MNQITNYTVENSLPISARQMENLPCSLLPKEDSPLCQLIKDRCILLPAKTIVYKRMKPQNIYAKSTPGTALFSEDDNVIFQVAKLIQGWQASLVNHALRTTEETQSRLGGPKQLILDELL